MEHLLWRPLDPPNIRDPYRMYADLRKHARVYRAQTGEFIITGYEEIKTILKNPMFRTGNRLDWLKREVRYLENKDQNLQAIHEAMSTFILMLNPPQHTRVRNFVNKAWDNRVVDEVIQANIDRLIAGLGDRSIDIARDYAQPLPVAVICDLLGVEVKEYTAMIDLAIGMNKTLDLYVTVKDLVTMNAAARQLVSFFKEHIEQKEKHPDESLLSKMITKNRDEHFGLSKNELASIGIFLFIAGAETAASLITNCFLLLGQYPEQQQLVRQNQDLIESAIEEVLRFDPPVQLLGRVATIDFSLSGAVIPANSAVTLVLASANRDENVFIDADKFLVTRKPNRHLSFGTGIHFCLGDWLGKREALLALRTFLRRYPSFSLAAQELTWNKNLAIRRLNSLVLDLFQPDS